MLTLRDQRLDRSISNPFKNSMDSLWANKNLPSTWMWKHAMAVIRTFTEVDDSPPWPGLGSM